MIDPLKPITLTREQLALFLPNHDSIKEFERLFKQDTALSILVANIIEGAGLNENGTYTAPTGSNYIDTAVSLYDADTLLDQAIFDETRDYIINVTGSTSLSASNQLVLCDATSGAIDITLPDPSLSFSDDRSYKIGVSKIDTTVNEVTIFPFGAELIVGEISQIMNSEGDILNFITDGTNWYLGA